MNTLKVFSFLIFFIITGCASFQPTNSSNDPNELSLYQMYIDSDGNLLNPMDEKIVADESDYIEKIYQNFERQKKLNPTLKLTVFIHGGLNTFESATSRVKQVKADMLANGNYPLFISWNSGSLPNYSDHLFLLRRGIKSPILGPISSPFVLLEDSLRSVARLPASTYNVVAGQNSVFKKIYSKEEAAADKALPELKKQGFIINNSPNDTGHNLSDWLTVWNPTKLITAPFVDTLGTGAWNSMLRRTDLVLRRDAGFNGISELKSDTAVTKFFNRYSTEYSDQEVVIIGHSMGTIIANNIISRYSNIKFSNIVYMAAACQIKDLEYVIAPYLKKNPSAEFYSLSLNPYRDISENVYFDFVPRGSLLIWIDQIFGATNSFQDRTAGYWFNTVRGASEAFKDNGVRSRVNLTQFGIKDGTPQTHQQFPI